MNQVRDLNDILVFTGSRPVFYQDIPVDNFDYSMNTYLYKPIDDLSKHTRDLADEAWSKGQKELSSYLHERVRKILDNNYD